jgi:hypothetical protein
VGRSTLRSIDGNLSAISAYELTPTQLAIAASHLAKEVGVGTAYALSAQAVYIDILALLDDRYAQY